MRVKLQTWRAFTLQAEWRTIELIGYAWPRGQYPSRHRLDTYAKLFADRVGWGRWRRREPMPHRRSASGLATFCLALMVRRRAGLNYRYISIAHRRARAARPILGRLWENWRPNDRLRRPKKRVAPSLFQLRTIGPSITARSPSATAKPAIPMRRMPDPLPVIRDDQV